MAGIQYNKPALIDGNGKLLRTSPDNVGGYITENQIKDWMINKTKEAIGSEFDETRAAILKEGQDQVAAVRDVYQSELAAIASDCEANTRKNRVQDARIRNLETALYSETLFPQTPVTTVDGEMETPFPPKVLPNAEINSVMGKTRKTKNLVNISSTVDGYQLPVPLPKGTYTISMETDANSIGVRFNGGSSETVANVGYSLYQGRKYVTINASFDVVSINVSAGGSSYTRNIQIEEGSVPTPYEPYFEGLQSARNVKVKSVGKNLLDMATMKADRISGGYPNITSTTSFSYVVPIKGGESVTISSSTAHTIFSCTTATYPTVGTPTVDNYTGTSGVSVTKKTIATSDSARWLIFHFGDHNYDGNVQVEYGSDATAYVPYSSQIVELPSTLKDGTPLVLRSAGSVRDTYEPSTGKVTKVVKEVDLASIASTFTQNATNPHRFSSLALRTEIRRLDEEEWRYKKISVCDEYNVLSYNDYDLDSTTDGLSLFPGNNGMTIGIKDSRYSTLADFQQNLRGVITYVGVDTNTEDSVDPISPFIGVEAGGTISVDSEGAQAEASITYITDLRS